MEKRQPSQVTISSPNHHDMLVNGLWNFYRSGHGADVPYLSGANTVWVHRLIVDVFLSSEKLGQASYEQTTSGRVTESDASIQMGYILEFIYKGTVSVGEDRLERLLATAKELGFTLLVDAVEAATATKTAAADAAGKLLRGLLKEQDSADTRRVSSRPVRAAAAISRMNMAEMDDNTGSGTNDTDITGQKVSAKRERFLRVIEGQKFTCGICSKVFAYKKTLALHQRIHGLTENIVVEPEVEEEQLFTPATSPVPDKTAGGKRGSRGPTRVAATGRFKCDLCFKTFARIGSARSHRRIHTGTNLHICEVCGRKCVSASILLLHSRSHTKERPYKCDFCDNTYFATKGQLVVHRRTHTGETPYKCKICNAAEFQQLMQLRRHQLTHGDPKPYKCPVCGRGFSQTENLKIHSRVHTNERPYICAVCGRGFKQSSTLAGHLRTHSGEKPYVCDTCGRSFSQKAVLVRHTRSHSGETPFQCQVCGRAFSHAQSLARHNLTHTGERPFSCDICGQTFARSHHLKTHAQKHHSF